MTSPQTTAEIFLAFSRDKLVVQFFEGVGDIFQEDQAEDDVLVFRRIHVVAELVCGEPKFGLKADGGRVVLFWSSHSDYEFLRSNHFIRTRDYLFLGDFEGMGKANRVNER